MDSPCSDKWELQYIGSAIKKQGGGLPGLRIVNSTIGRHKERKTNATRHPDRHRPALHFATAVAHELTAEQRSACMGDYEKYCKGVTPGGGRIIACLTKESDKITPACKKALAAADKK